MFPHSVKPRDIRFIQFNRIYSNSLKSGIKDLEKSKSKAGELTEAQNKVKNLIDEINSMTTEIRHTSSVQRVQE